MIWQVGLTGVLESFQALGPWIIPYLLLKGVRTVIDTAGWASCFPGRRLAVPFWHLLLVSRAGSAINQVTPTAAVGGEVVKVLLLASQMPREQAFGNQGARFMVLSLLGVTQVYGLAFGLVARVEQLLWSGMGFLAYGIYPRYVRPVTAPRPEDLRHTKGTGFPNAYGESL